MRTPSYHITHIDNLAGIIRAGGLWCDAERVRQHVPSVEIGYHHIKQRRARIPIMNRAGQSVSAGGFLADYVPFYFANRTPMLYTIFRGNVSSYTGGQADVVYLVTSVEVAVDGNRDFCFTDGHAAQAMTEFHSDLERLNTLDWTVIRDRYWAKTNQDPDRIRRKQAEFLVHTFVPWHWFQRIGVIDNGRSQRVREIIAEAQPQPKVTIERGWYY